MSHRSEREQSKRRHRRVIGPFDGHRMGLIDLPLRIFDLSEGGCFVNSVLPQREGTTFQMRIDLPFGEPVTVVAETLHQRPGGYAVRFVDVDAVTSERLSRVVDARTRQTSR